MVTKHIVGAQSAGHRLDHVLRDLFPNTPRRVLLLWLKQGCVKLDGRAVRKGQLVTDGQELTVTSHVIATKPEEPKPLVVLFEDESVVVIDKPSGQASTSLEGGATGSLAAQLLHRYPDMRNVGHGPQDAGLIHRLDTGTSGVIVAAKTKAAFAALTVALNNGELHKTYLAWTAGTLPNARGTIEAPLCSDPKNRKRVIVAAKRHRTRPPIHVTHYEVLGEDQGVTVVRLRAPVATRHQIRAHMASVGCPLLGDLLYGGQPHTALNRHALHASQVCYRGSVACNSFDCTSLAPEDVRGLAPAVRLD